LVIGIIGVLRKFLLGTRASKGSETRYELNLFAYPKT